jgi:hypothetical protein
LEVRKIKLQWRRAAGVDVDPRRLARVLTSSRRSVPRVENRKSDDGRGAFCARARRSDSAVGEFGWRGFLRAPCR